MWVCSRRCTGESLGKTDTTARGPPARAISFAMPRHPVRSVHRSHALAHMYTQLAAAVARGLTSLLLQQAVALYTPDLDQLLRLADGLARVADRVQPRRCLRTSLRTLSAGFGRAARGVYARACAHARACPLRSAWHWPTILLLNTQGCRTSGRPSKWVREV